MNYNIYFINEQLTIKNYLLSAIFCGANNNYYHEIYF